MHTDAFNENMNYEKQNSLPMRTRLIMMPEFYSSHKFRFYTLSSEMLLQHRSFKKPDSNQNLRYL